MRQRSEVYGRIMLRPALITTAVLALLAGCSSSGDTALREGKISGQLTTVGGPAPGEARPTAGTVKVEDDSGSWQMAEVGADGRFTLTVTVGTYSVSEVACGGEIEVTVVRDQVSSADIVCHVP